MDISSPLVLGIGAGLVAGAATLAGAVPAITPFTLKATASPLPMPGMGGRTRPSWP